ncbi:MAG: hypothetical protein HYZ52_03015 [Candidatus Omnitrophica bacterium]|nr:hypothetical protein [Candidatus Omnitrophota bacterium]
MKSRFSRKSAALKFLLVVLLMGAALFFVKAKKAVLVEKCARLLQSIASRETDLNVRIGKVSGHLFGRVEFGDISVDDPSRPPGQTAVFRAKRIRFRYHFLDFLSKTFDSPLEILIEEPEVRWRPHLGVRRRSPFPFSRWMREGLLSQKRNLAVRIENMTVVWGARENKAGGIGLVFQNNAFHAEIPLHHVDFFGADLSSTIRAEGHFEIMPFSHEENLAGVIGTEGTVINWKPLPSESRFNFELSDRKFEVVSQVFGGLALDGAVDFTKDNDIRLTVRGTAVPLSGLAFLNPSSAGAPAAVPGMMDVDMKFEGNPGAPNTEIHWRLTGGGFYNKNFKSLDVNLVGVYPTLSLSDSRVLLKDGSVMRFANKTLEFSDLFRPKAFEALVSQAQQDAVAWGDWEFRRPRDLNDQPEFLMERTLGENARLQFRQFNADQEMDRPESDKMEVGLEWHLRPKEALKVGLRDDERFVGVERKVKF